MTNPDITRSSFDENKKYSKVIFQQGKPLLEADLNEQVEINNNHFKQFVNDMTGKSGTFDEMAFRITLNDSSPYYFLIYPGIYYVDGVQCALFTNKGLPLKSHMQPDLPSYNGHTSSPAEEGHYLVYLDRWDRPITSIEEKAILESALNGVETCGRSKMVTQIKIKKLNYDFKKDSYESINTYECSKLEESKEWLEIIKKDTCTLSARTSKEVASKEDPCCDMQFDSGYTGNDNALYRVEIHQSDTFKFSDDNASTSANVLQFRGNKIYTSWQSKGNLRLFKRGDYFEILDDRLDLWGLSGPTMRVLDVQPYKEGYEITYEDIPKFSLELEYPMKFNPKIVKWKSNINVINNSQGDGQFIKLEKGIEVKFSNDQRPPKSHWLIPARVNEADVIWPKDKNGKPLQVPPNGIQHHYCILGSFDFVKMQVIIDDWEATKKSPTMERVNAIIEFVQRNFQDGLVDLEVGQNIQVKSIQIDDKTIGISIKSNKNVILLKDQSHNEKESVILEINDIVVFSFILEHEKSKGNQKKMYLGQIQDLVDCRNILPNFSNSASFSGILQIDCKESDSVYGPFSHGISGYDIPPAVMLGLISIADSKSNKKYSREMDSEVICLDDFELCEDQLRFNAVKISKDYFFVAIKHNKKQADLYNKTLILRFWSIPSKSVHLQVPMSHSVIDLDTFCDEMNPKSNDRTKTILNKRRRK